MRRALVHRAGGRGDPVRPDTHFRGNLFELCAARWAEVPGVGPHTIGSAQRGEPMDDSMTMETLIRSAGMKFYSSQVTASDS